MNPGLKTKGVTVKGEIAKTRKKTISLRSIIPMVLKVSSSSPRRFSFVSFLGEGGASSFLPFFFPGDADFVLFPAALAPFERLRSSFFVCFAAASAALGIQN